ncbi:MAG: RidA family protein [Candidatus Hodarchaeales archaeon]|jgi:2-iminobutanoate/2-iminopropanoate deaminase
MREVLKTGKVLGPYSPGIVASGAKQIFISGQIADDLDADIRTQTIQIIKKMEAILAETNAFLSDIVKTTIYLADINDFKELNEEYGLQFPSDPPARATLQAAALPLGAKVMIDAIAMRME